MGRFGERTGAFSYSMDSLIGMQKRGLKSLIGKQDPEAKSVAQRYVHNLILLERVPEKRISRRRLDRLADGGILLDYHAELDPGINSYSTRALIKKQDTVLRSLAIPLDLDRIVPISPERRDDLIKRHLMAARVFSVLLGMKYGERKHISLAELLNVGVRAFDSEGRKTRAFQEAKNDGLGFSKRHPDVERAFAEIDKKRKFKFMAVQAGSEAVPLTEVIASYMGENRRTKRDEEALELCQIQKS